VRQYVFIDESGDLGRHGSKYFIIAALLTRNPIQIHRIIKRIRQRRLKKTIREKPEIKANNSNDRIKTLVLTKVSKADCSIIALVVRKDRIFDRLMGVQNRLYNYLCSILLENISSNGERVIVVIDKKYTNRLLMEDFDGYIGRKLAFRNINAIISQIPSHTSNELQVVDFVAWAINRKYNLDDSRYYDIIKDKISNRDSMIWPR
jgi:hypothetical protein